MNENRLKQHGQAILEAAKDHLHAALESAPPTGWTAVEWAEQAGLLLEGASFAAVFAHHLGPVLLREGRAAEVGDGAIPRYTVRRAGVEQPAGAVSAATSAPEPWSPTTTGGAFQALPKSD
jgi:hypothetical protein